MVWLMQKRPEALHLTKQVTSNITQLAHPGLFVRHFPYSLSQKGPSVETQKIDFMKFHSK